MKIELWLCVVAVVLVSVKGLGRHKRYSRRNQLFNCNLDLSGEPVSPRKGSNGFSVHMDAPNGSFRPGLTYTISLKSTNPVTMRGFALSAKYINSNDAAGSLKILDPWITKYMDSCPDKVTHRSQGKRSHVQFAWAAPIESTKNCVIITASVIQKGSIWFKGADDLFTTVCPEEESKEEEVNAQVGCCSCGSATYKMTFHGLWSPETHPKDYPSYSTHWSNVIGASHSTDYTIWKVGGYSGQGVKAVAEWGWPNTLEQEINGQGEAVKSLIKTSAQWPAYKPRNLGGQPLTDNFVVDREHHLVSLLSMLGPSPDWNVGITRESMCTESCDWMRSKTYDLIPWDAGTDSGVTYLSPNSPTIPPEKIRMLTSSDSEHSPFYDPTGGPIKPVARVVIERINLLGDQCGEDTSDIEIDVTHEAENDIFCQYSEWGEWSECGLSCWGIRMRTKNLLLNQYKKCAKEVTEKEICKGQPNSGEESTMCCLYTEWSEWSSCLSQCTEDNLRFRTRKLQWPSEPEDCPEPLKEMLPCDTCPTATCMYSEWSEWMPCSSTCGIGQTMRKRFIKQELESGTCNENLIEQSKCMASVSCNDPDPSFDILGCVYSPWSNWMPCPSKCGTGETFRKRTLASTTSGCKNIQMETTKCMTSLSCDVTPPTCMYAEWSDWMPCSVTCGVGLTFRKSFLKVRPPGITCDEVRMENSTCHRPPCEESPATSNCVYQDWSDWMSCSVTCGKGTTLRKRFLQKKMSADANCEEVEMETNRCMVPMLCPDEIGDIDVADCDWGNWSTCSATCGRGQQMRKRSPACGENLQTRTCREQACAIDCEMSDWGEWSRCTPCSVQPKTKKTTRSFEPGWKVRIRERVKKRRNGGRACPRRREKRKCIC